MSLQPRAWRRLHAPAFASLALIAALLPASPGRAQQGSYAREGWYAGVSLAIGVNTFEREVEDHTNFRFDLDESVGVDGRAGYRLHPNLAAELEVEYVSPFDLKSGTAGNFRVEPTVFTLNAKGYLATGIFQPYLSFGAGGMHVDQRDKGAQVPIGPPGAGLTTGVGDRDKFGAALRFGGGVEYYVTEQLVVNVGASYVLPLHGFVEKFDYISIEALGVMYRF